ncbi:hypothetical protein GCM10010420_48710 [Streptomyces glaucosporus]|uniref:BACON domain-containing protein n=1 Tax=Streptomyces glaucosporus TaxID=284044 RepID=A0ABP5VWU4_9ACTN
MIPGLPPTVDRVMSTRREHPAHPTGAHRAHRGTRRAAAQPPVCFDPYLDHLDGLFTYCLSVMCEHEAATAALGEALAVADRQRRRGRTPGDTALHRAWLYALARWACLRRLAERQGRPEPPELPGPVATARRRELAALAWPEAAGTNPEQREALELAVRHHLPVHEVAAVLGLDGDGTELLLSSGACEVERTRTALAVLDRGGCASVSRLAGNREVLLGSALRRELVRHVDECPECRRTAERVLAGGPWPGTAPADTGTLTVLKAPRDEVYAAMLTALRARAQHTPRFDRRGFPAGAGDRAERFDRLRSRAVTTTVVATVIAAPVLALWAAYRGAPLADAGPGSAPVSAAEREEAGGSYDAPHPERGPAGGAGASRDGGGVRVDVGAAGGGEASPRGSDRPERAGGDGARKEDGRTGPGRLTVEARPAGDATLVTLTASGGRPVRWSASADAPWLRLSRTHGTLRPGESATITVTVDRAGARRHVDGTRLGPPGQGGDHPPGARQRAGARRAAAVRPSAAGTVRSAPHRDPGRAVRTVAGPAGPVPAAAGLDVPGPDAVRLRVRLRVHGTRERRRVRRVGDGQQRSGRQPLLAQPGQPLVPRRAHQLRQLRPVRHVHRLAGLVGGRRAGAPPVEVVSARPPAAAVVLADRDVQLLLAVRQLHPLERPPDRQLPAHVRLGLQRLAALPQRHRVQRAARAGREAGTVEEDARTLVEPRLPLAVLVHLDPAALGGPLRVELPELGRETRSVRRHALLVLLVGEVRPQRAAAVARPSRADALAPPAEDAAPARGQPRQVAAEHLLVVRRVRELHPHPGVVQAHLLVPGAPRLTLRVPAFALVRRFRLRHAPRVCTPVPSMSLTRPQ